MLVADTDWVFLSACNTGRDPLLDAMHFGP